MERARILGLRRKAVNALVLGLFPREITRNSAPLDRVREYAKEGYGIVLIYNHFSKSDHLRAMGSLLREVPILAERRILSPVALHQNKPILKVLKRLSKIDLKIIVTEDTKEEAKKPDSDIRLPSRDESYEYYKDFKDAARNVLSNGGVVVIAPQAGRRDTLGEPPGKPIARLLRNYDNEKIVFVCVGLGLPAETDYGDEKVQGYGVRKPYTAEFGKPLTREELMARCGGNEKNIDHAVFRELSYVVPLEYI